MAEAPVRICPCVHVCCADQPAHIHQTGGIVFVDAVEQQFPSGCTCERIDVHHTGQMPGEHFIRGRSDPPCTIHLPQERALYDTGYQRGLEDGRNAKAYRQPRRA